MPDDRFSADDMDALAVNTERLAKKAHQTPNQRNLLRLIEGAQSAQFPHFVRAQRRNAPCNKEIPDLVLQIILRLAAPTPLTAVKVPNYDAMTDYERAFLLALTVDGKRLFCDAE